MLPKTFITCDGCGGKFLWKKGGHGKKRFCNDCGLTRQIKRELTNYEKPNDLSLHREVFMDCEKGSVML